MPDVYIAKEGAIVEYDGRPIVIRKGRTRVEAGHELLTRFPRLFEPAADGAQFRVTTARNEPIPAEAGVAKLKRLKVGELVKYADEHSIDLGDAKLKPEIIDAISRAQLAPPTASSDSDTPEPTTDGEGQEHDGDGEGQEPPEGDQTDGEQGQAEDGGDKPADAAAAPPAQE